MTLADTQTSAPTLVNQEDHPSDNTVPSWVTETVEAAEKDNRIQPWRLAFGDDANNRFDDGTDLVKVEKSIGGKFDPDCPFRTQGSSLAA
jgi:hypothetical protein